MFWNERIVYFVYAHSNLMYKHSSYGSWLCRDRCPVSGYVMAQVIQLENFFLTKKGKANLFLSSLFSRYVVLKWQQQVFVLIELELYWCITGNILFLYINKNVNTRDILTLWFKFINSICLDRSIWSWNKSIEIRNKK